MAKFKKGRNKLGWSPVRFSESKNISIEQEDPKFNSPRKFYANNVK